MRPARSACILLCLVLPPALTACAPFPLEGSPGTDAAQAAPWPVLLPLDQVLARQDAVTITEASNAELLARAAALRARAAGLRGRQVGG